MSAWPPDDRPPGPDAPGEALAGGELRRRATGGALLLSARGTLILVLGVGANIALARLLVPRDFGLVALGTVLLVFGGHFANGGLGAALIGRESRPSNRELEAVAGAQLATSVMLAVASAGAAIPFGRDGLVVALMVASLPITMMKTPAIIVLERGLDYRVIATVDVVEALAFYCWALVTVALGMGVWGMASGMAVRAVAGTALMSTMGPFGLVRPRLDWPAVRPLLGFGLKVQAVTVVALLREQGLNVAVAAIAGVATLGVWNLAWRVLQVPYMLFATVGRVAYPAMSRLLAAGEDPGHAIERAVITVAVATGLALVAIVGLAPALPALVGPGWGDVPETLLWSALALMITAPVAVVVVGFLFAADAVGTVVRVGLAQVAAWFAVTLPLLARTGAPAIGIGWVAGAVLSGSLYVRIGQRRTSARVLRSLAAPTGLALLGGVAGWGTATVAGETVLAGLAGMAAGESVLISGLLLLRRGLLGETYALLARSARRPLKREAELAA